VDARGTPDWLGAAANRSATDYAPRWVGHWVYIRIWDVGWCWLGWCRLATASCTNTTGGPFLSAQSAALPVVGSQTLPADLRVEVSTDYFESSRAVVGSRIQLDVSRPKYS